MKILEVSSQVESLEKSYTSEFQMSLYNTLFPEMKIGSFKSSWKFREMLYFRIPSVTLPLPQKNNVDVWRHNFSIYEKIVNHKHSQKVPFGS